VNESAEKLLSSFLLFTRTMFQLRTGRELILTVPQCRESHLITLSRALMQLFKGEIANLEINIPPRHLKTEFCIHFIAWALAHHPDCNFIYTSYSHSLAAKQTDTVRQIINMVEYQRWFPHVQLSDTTAAKDNFETTAGGSVYAVGTGGSITGRGAGIKGADRFGGCIILDDPIKPADATSDTIRDNVNGWYFNTLMSRRNNGDGTPILFVGQITHEDDLAMNLRKGFDGLSWENLVLQAINDDGNALDPALESFYKNMADKSPYVFSAQYQQSPTPADGGIFKREMFRYLPIEPDVFASFIIADTAETEKTYNDATAFTHLGLYKVKNGGIDTGLLALHVIDCWEIRVEPDQLEPRFLSFWQKAMTHRCKPQYAYIEKKSTGVTLISVLKKVQGLTVMAIQRGSNAGNKTTRFLNAQPSISSGLLTFTEGDEHASLVIDHMTKITANDTHMHDDIADTICDGIRIALIDKSLPSLGLEAKQAKVNRMAQGVAAINTRL
jgi:predicted phage terminase large subunit-like protein